MAAKKGFGLVTILMANWNIAEDIKTAKEMVAGTRKLNLDKQKSGTPGSLKTMWEYLIRQK